jgi:MFS family permease
MRMLSMVCSGKKLNLILYVSSLSSGKERHAVAKNSMTTLERRSVTTLASVFSLRMFGLFLILPVFSLYAEDLKGHTPFLIGMALGAYGLTQAILQIPYGLASDRFGRKPMIILGLLVFAIGSAVAAMSTTILGVILGRALQGAGAIAAVVIALTADLTREEQRTKAMAMIGVTIGMTFLVSLMVAPVLNLWVGVPGIFWLTAALALVGILVVAVAVPAPVSARHHRDVQPVPAQFGRVLRDGNLLRLDLGIFLLHFALTALFVAMPLALVEWGGLPKEAHWKVYVPVIILSVVGMVPLVAMSHRKDLIRWIYAAGIGMLGLAQFVFYIGHHRLVWLIVGLWVFFVGFNVLEALLPSLVSRVAPADSKGTAIGVYNSFEFFGAFLGGALGGFVHGAFGLHSVFAMCGAVIVAWFVVALTSPSPRLLDTRLLRVGARAPNEAQELAARLAQIPGVAEAIVVGDEGVAYLKIDSKTVDAAALDQFAINPG